MNNMNHIYRINNHEIPCANQAVLTNRNVNRLKHEVSVHNPRNLSPDGMMNHILDLYFAFVEAIR